MKLTDLRQEFLMGEERPFESCHASTLLKLKNGDIPTDIISSLLDSGTILSISCRRPHDDDIG